MTASVNNKNIVQVVFAFMIQEKYLAAVWLFMCRPLFDMHTPLQVLIQLAINCCGFCLNQWKINKHELENDSLLLKFGSILVPADTREGQLCQPYSCMLQQKPATQHLLSGKFIAAGRRSPWTQGQYYSNMPLHTLSNVCKAKILFSIWRALLQHND